MGTTTRRWIFRETTAQATTKAVLVSGASEAMLSKAPASSDAAKPLKTCGVCGDHAKSFHFGGLSCDSCKAFFRRSVQNDAYKTFQCAFRGHCDITMANRKCCQFCRFRKCLDIGMETSWVMSEEERLHLLRSRMEKRRRVERSPLPPSLATKRRRRSDREAPEMVADGDRTSSDADDDWRRELDDAVRLFRSWFGTNEPDGVERASSFEDGRWSRWRLLVRFVVSVHKLVRFARGVPAFSDLPVRDQISLLRANLFEMFLALHFSELDPIRSGPAETECPFLLAAGDEPSIAAEDVPWHDSSFRTLFRSTVADARTLVLLLVVILFSSDSADLADAGPAQASQVRFCRLLGRHLAARKGSGAWPRPLLLLPTLREIREKHVTYPFDVRDEDLAVVERCAFHSVDDDLLRSVITANLGNGRSCSLS